jgi:hypothetical protein
MDYPKKENGYFTGWMDYQTIGLKGVSDVHFARNQFFLAFFKIIPEAMDDIINMISIFEPLYSELGQKYGYHKTNWNLREMKEFYQQNPSENFVLFQNTLINWAQTYNVSNDFWVINEIPQTLSMWIKKPEYKEKRHFQYLGDNYFMKLLEESKKRFQENVKSKEEIVRKFLEAKDELSQVMENPFSTLGYEQHYHKILDEFMISFKIICGYDNSKRKRTLVHFEWLVYFYIKRFSHEEIARMYREESTEPNKLVSREVNKLIKLIGLTNKGVGRPRKNLK